jgi:cephalosporin hydroxylase
MATSLSLLYCRYDNSTEPAAGWGDKGTTHSFIEVYQEILRPYADLPGNVLEIGILNGTSLLMWEKYFANANVYGADCTWTPLDKYDLRPLAAAGHRVRILNCSDPADVEKHFGGMTFNVIIEDAAHDIGSQLAIYRNFRDRLSQGGIYVIEDVQDIDTTRSLFEKIDPERQVTIYDRRHVKRRFDDVMVVIR